MAEKEKKSGGNFSRKADKVEQGELSESQKENLKRHEEAEK